MVHGAGGLDEFAPGGRRPTSPSCADGAVARYELTPARLRPRRERSGRAAPAATPADNAAHRAARSCAAAAARRRRNAALMTAARGALRRRARRADLRAGAPPRARGADRRRRGAARVLETLRRIAPRAGASAHDPRRHPGRGRAPISRARSGADRSTTLEARGGRAGRRRAASRAALRRPGRGRLHRRVQAPLAVGRLDPRGADAGRRSRAAYAAGRRARRCRCSPTGRSSAARSTICARARARRARCRSCARTSSSTRYQVVEARAAGADAVLLIVARPRRRRRCAALLGAPRASCGLDALVEVHDDGEVGARAGRRRRDHRRQPPRPRHVHHRPRAGRAPARRASPPTVLVVAESGIRDAGRRRAAARRRRRRDPGRRDADARARSRGAALRGAARLSSHDEPFLVKICGVTTPDDARGRGGAGADAIGFNFWPGSKRYVDPTRRRARSLAAVPRRRAARSASSSTRPPTEVDARAGRARASTGRSCTATRRRRLRRRSPARLIRAVRVRDEASFAAERRLAPGAVALRRVVDGYGGARRAGALAAHRRARARRPFLLAGGLTPDNVADGDRAPCAPTASTSPAASSARPGVKDPDKVAAFVAAARGAI